jgi:glycosyltransferase involved in cell wall biosynthesis
MKILHINTYDIDGGAARATYRLHKALLSSGVDSQMLVQSKSSDDFTVFIETGKVRKILTRLNPHIDSIPVRFYKNRIGTLFSPSSYSFGNIVNKINDINPHIVHLHWICGGMMRIEDIARIKAPIVWTLHDNWAFTGGCHIMWECEKYKKECNSCFVLGSSDENDLSKKVFNRKEKYFSKINNLTIVGVSNWLKNCSKQSKLLGYRKHYTIGNSIDTDIFKPFDKEKARELWNLPKNKKLVLFGAMSATSDKNKGFEELSQALEKIDKNNYTEFVVFGSSRPQNAPNFGFKTHYLGKLADDISLVTLYSAVDIMIVPSIQEAFGQTASEAMACGTPVVAFGATGLLDIIDHKINGYLAKPFDTTDLKDGIEWVLNAPNYDELCLSSREKVVREFGSKVVAKKYINLYKEILDGN